MNINKPILTKEGKLPQTQDELAQIMLDASIEVARSKHIPPNEDETVLAELISRPSEFVLDAVPEDIEKGAEYLKNINQLFDNNTMGARIMMCKLFHDQCREYQAKHNISGLHTTKVQVGNLSVEFLSERNPLNILDSDKKQLLEQIKIIWDFFVNAAAMGVYDLIEDDPETNSSPTKLSTIEEHLILADQVEISTESFAWMKKGNNWSGIYINRNIPDRVKLSVSTNIDSPTSNTRYFYLEHRECTKFPWKQL